MISVFGLFIVLICGVTVPVVKAKYPSEYPRCHVGDMKCLPEVMNFYLRESASGISSLNIIPIDPLFVPSVDIIQSRESPVNIKLYTKNVDFLGFSKLVINETFGFTDHPDTSEFELIGYIPQLVLVGDYKITGSVLILPIVGEGHLNITMDNLDFSLKLDKTVEQKKGKTYLSVKRTYVDFNTTRVHMLLENLFNGDKLLGDTTNLFLNENWEDVINELKPVLKDAIGVIAGKIIKAVFDKYPYEEFWL